MDPDAEEIQEEAQPTKLFDLPETEGVNESERILAALCRQTFLRLWSQTNVYTNDDFKNGKGATQELCDALVVFGKEVILFSDKHILFNEAKGLEVAWPLVQEGGVPRRPALRPTTTPLKWIDASGSEFYRAADRRIRGKRHCTWAEKHSASLRSM
ncbi:hypothetical protein LJR260_001560 [Variovorax paradoxus]|uniref:hypothetical protein n=1 Tax=Variovorax paradoxus TaxID=34073 RepID=UPI003ED1160F